MLAHASAAAAHLPARTHVHDLLYSHTRVFKKTHVPKYLDTKAADLNYFFVHRTAQHNPSLCKFVPLSLTIPTNLIFHNSPATRPCPAAGRINIAHLYHT
eukprot:scpid95514/ scgid33139/ 